MKTFNIYTFFKNGKRRKKPAITLQANSYKEVCIACGQIPWLTPDGAKILIAELVNGVEVDKNGKPIQTTY